MSMDKKHVKNFIHIVCKVGTVSQTGSIGMTAHAMDKQSCQKFDTYSK
jgi:hypothetical protein